MDVKKSTRQKFRLRNALVIPLAVQIITASGLVGYFAFRSGQQAVNDVAGQLRNELTNRISEKLASYAEIPHVINQLNAGAVAQGEVDILNGIGEYQLWQQMQIYPDVSNIYCGSEDGSFIGVTRQLENGELKLKAQFVNPSTQFIRQSIELNRQGSQVGKSIALTKPYDPRKRPWYEAAKTSETAIWTDVYLDFSTLLPTVTASLPVYDNADGSFIASCAIDFFLPQELTKFLQSLEIGKSGTAFIIDRSGKLIATSTQESMTYGSGENTDRLFSWNSGNTTIKETAKYLNNKFTELEQIQSIHQIEMELDHEHYYIQVVPFKNRNLDWLVILTLPESDFMGKIHEGRQNALWLSLASLGLAIVVSIFTARLIIRPILRLTQTSKVLAEGHLNQRINTKSLIDIEEIEILKQSFNGMAGQLEESFTALEYQKEVLADQNEKLQHFDQLKDEFLANTSHEIRTPLNGIIGITESLIDGVTGELPTSTRANLQLVVSSGRRLSSLINDILDFSKLRHQNLALQLSSVDVRSVTQIILALSQPLVQQTKLRLINAIAQDLPDVQADENRLQQILYNLVGNAIKFTPSGKIEISASLIESASGKFLSVTVSDTGIGIAEDKLEDIFKSFEQAEGSTAREYGGTGLGLAVTKQLVELHGGEMSVRSRVGVGSHFTFTLPIAKKRSTAPKAVSVLHENTGFEVMPSALRLSSNKPEVSEPQFTILVVDDEPINRQVLVNNLSLYNYSIVEASNGEDALTLIDNGLIPDLVLLDIMMPRMTGYEVCHKIRERFLTHELPVVMLTAKSQVENIVEGFSSGANDYLAKPIQKQEMLARMKTHLNLTKLTSAYERFVPRDFLEFLEKDSIIDVQIGNQVQQEMTVMFSDIRAFTTIAEPMTPQETFNFINAYLSRVSPVIRECGGFVDKYIGDAIMALFPRSADDAVQAAIALQARVRLYNQEQRQEQRAQGLDAIEIGVGLHTGNLMLGTIGESERMETTVIADAVNLASRLEGLTKVYGARIVLSEYTLAQLKMPQHYHFRFLDRVRVKGKSNVVSIYELFDEPQEFTNQLKIQTEQTFEAAVTAYYQKDFVKAQSAFEEVLRINPEDKAAMLYIRRCQQLQQATALENWDGITNIDLE